MRWKICCPWAHLTKSVYMDHTVTHLGFRLWMLPLKQDQQEWMDYFSMATAEHLVPLGLDFIKAAAHLCEQMDAAPASIPHSRL